MRLAALFYAAVLPCAAQVDGVPPVDRDRVSAVFKTFLRDSAELPMDVAVTTVVADARGREKRHTHSTVRLLFRGYNQQGERFSMRAQAGLFSYRLLHDSMAGDLAIFRAFSLLGVAREAQASWTLTEDRAGLRVRSAPVHCSGFIMDGELFPKHDCAAAEFQLGRDAAGELTVDGFSLDSTNLPAAGKVRYLGPVQVRRYHVEGNLQNGYLADDPRPFLVPKHVVATIETDKGTIVVTDDHTVATKQ